MFIYKNFIEPSENGTFYPISRIFKLKIVSALLTEIFFDDKVSTIVGYPIKKLIVRLNGEKE